MILSLSRVVLILLLFLRLWEDVYFQIIQQIIGFVGQINIINPEGRSGLRLGSVHGAELPWHAEEHYEGLLFWNI